MLLQRDLNIHKIKNRILEISVRQETAKEGKERNEGKGPLQRSTI